MSAPPRSRPAVAPPDGSAVRPDRVYLGWQYAPRHTDPGPLPRRPAPPAPEQLNQGWVDAQRREENRLDRPLKLACGASLALFGLVTGLGVAGLLNIWLTVVLAVLGVAAAAASGHRIRQAERVLRERIAAEQQRVAKIRDVQLSRLAVRQEQHAQQVRAWESRREAFDRQLQWYAVSLPDGIDRIDVAGGTLAGWSALLTMIAAPRLSAGGDVTVIDLTEGAVARDLLAVARRSGVQPLVWVLPNDLPRLDLGGGLGAAALADVLATTVAASDEPDGSPARAPVDSSILDRVLGVLGDTASIAQVTAALRVLAQVGDPREDMSAGRLTAGQLERLGTLFGRGAADRVVIERAWAIESRLRKLDRLGSAAEGLPPSRLRVAWLDRRAGPLDNRVLASYLAVALTHTLRQAPAGPGWQQTLCVLGADKLHGDVLDRLIEACEVSGTGLVVGYRSLAAPARERLGRGNAAVAFMRLGNAEEARAASEQIGSEHRFVVSQLTDTVGVSLTDTEGDSYTSTVGTADSVADTASVSDTRGRSSGRGRSRQGSFAPFAPVIGSASRDSSRSRGTSDSRSITAGISASTAWGISTSRAVGASSSAARTVQRSRELLVEPHELQQLPPSAVIVTYAGPDGRQVVLADANPGIIALRTSTLLSLDEAVATAATIADPDPAGAWSPETASQETGDPETAGRETAGPETAGRETAGQATAAPGTTPPGRAAPPPRPRPNPYGPPAGEDGAEPPPNLGPPPERLDWRKGR
ncbi:MAG TPA: hypothetical protein VH480_10195 [Streptosporangiaceae bacterium]